MSDYKPLRDKVRWHENDMGLPKYFPYEDVASAVRFYKKYKDPNVLAVENTDVYDIFSDYYLEKYGFYFIKSPKFNERYKEWLFDYTFKDVI